MLTEVFEKISVNMFGILCNALADFIAANAVGGIATAQMPQVTSGIVQTSAMAASPTVYSYSSATAMQQQHQQQFAQSQIASVIHNQVGHIYPQLHLFSRCTEALPDAQ